MKTNALVNELVEAFCRRKPVRAGSLIVTLYGDAIVPRGGSLSLGDITRIMQFFRIDSGHVRTAISRLTTGKWLERKKFGRNTYYRLSKAGEGEFAEATKRIYFANHTESPKFIRLALLNGDASSRVSHRSLLEAAGYAPFNATTYVSADLALTPKGTKDIHLLEVRPSAGAVEVLRISYKLNDLAEQYREFIDLFSKLGSALSKGIVLDDSDALAIRLLLIQEFRRIVLRDPALPASLLPAKWPAEDARKLAAEIYAKVLEGAERQLDLCQADEKNALPKPNLSLHQRFTALQY